MSEYHRISVWVDDPNSVYRLGLVACLAAPEIVVAGASAAFNPWPDVSGVDVLLFAVDDLRSALAVSDGTGTRLVAMADDSGEEALLAAVETGVAGAVIRSEITPDALLQCLRLVANGSASLPASVLTMLTRPRCRSRSKPADGLTRRQLDVLRLLAEGVSTREIAQDLYYSEKTVKNIVHDVLVQMSCRNRAEAVALATRDGVI